MVKFIQSHRKTVLELIGFIVMLELFNATNLQDFISVFLDIVNLYDLTSSESTKFFEIIFKKLQHLKAIRELVILCEIYSER